MAATVAGSLGPAGLRATFHLVREALVSWKPIRAIQRAITARRLRPRMVHHRGCSGHGRFYTSA